MNLWDFLRNRRAAVEKHPPLLDSEVLTDAELAMSEDIEALQRRIKEMEKRGVGERD